MKTFLSRHLLFNLALFSLQKCFCFVTTTSKQQQQPTTAKTTAATTTTMSKSVI